MTLRNLTSILNRTSISSNAYYSNFFFKKYACTYQSMLIRSFSSKFVLSSSNSKFKPLCLLKPSTYHIKVKASFRMKYSYNCYRYFHTSERRYLHPVFWAVLRPFFKVMAIFTGR